MSTSSAWSVKLTERKRRSLRVRNEYPSTLEFQFWERIRVLHRQQSGRRAFRRLTLVKNGHACLTVLSGSPIEHERQSLIIARALESNAEGSKWTRFISQPLMALPSSRLGYFCVPSPRKPDSHKVRDVGVSARRSRTACASAHDCESPKCKTVKARGVVNILLLSRRQSSESEPEDRREQDRPTIRCCHLRQRTLRIQREM